MCSSCDDTTTPAPAPAVGAPAARRGVLWWLQLPLFAVGQLLIFLVRVYQVAIRPWFPASCRYRPGCSTYMIDAITQKGVLLGPLLGLYRLVRCQPLGSYGFDPVEAYPPWRIDGRLRWKLTTDEREALLAATHHKLCETMAARGDRDGLAMVGGWAYMPDDDAKAVAKKA